MIPIWDWDIPICLANVYLNHRHNFRRVLRNNVWYG